jgi:hypothetical protein
MQNKIVYYFFWTLGSVAVSCRWNPSHRVMGIPFHRVVGYGATSSLSFAKASHDSESCYFHWFNRAPGESATSIHIGITECQCMMDNQFSEFFRWEFQVQSSHFQRVIKQIPPRKHSSYVHIPCIGTRNLISLYSFENCEVTLQHEPLQFAMKRITLNAGWCGITCTPPMK